MRIPMIIAMIAAMGLPAQAQTVPPEAVAAIAAADEDWDIGYALARDAGPVTIDAITWLRLRAGDATFAEYREFITQKAGWPGIRRLRAEAELVIDEGHDPAQVIAFFAEDAPQTGEGAVRLAEALIASDQEDEARAALRAAWINLRLSEDGHEVMVASFGDLLQPFHRARVDALMWRSRRAEAERMLPLLDEGQKAFTTARIGYASGTRNMRPLYDAVPAALRADPGFAYDRYSWLASRGEWTDAVEMLMDRSTSRAALGEPLRWSGYRRILARWEMREGRAQQAYDLASRHYLSEGSSYADLEWLSGYIALTYLGDPELARGHFENGLRVSTGPISVSRMQYWIGRAQSVLGETDAAAAAYAAAAEHQTAFYGLLASEQTGRPLAPTLSGSAIAWRDAPVFDDEIVKAALTLLAGGERGAAFTFFAALGQSLDAEGLTALGAYLSEIDEHRYTLLLGKAAVTRGILIPEIYFPIHDLAEMDLPAAPALSLSIARRESEFNESIGSPVGALGLMQLMPATAQEVSEGLGLPYSRGRLTSDWQYNATLGAQYLDFLTQEFGPTPVMIAAGYNAGPSRPIRWIDERGDPRLREMDVVDWIEHIPFRETRNYVMRVTESIPIYEARLTGQTGPVRFTALLEGRKPLIRPVARPAPDVAMATSSAPSMEVLTETPDVRPVARPGG
ncbi:lytic transglycosylase domain-containing protein [Loktanella sp. Alg231-35]|uniref:lytic transglycosylase domain-containing protein n=1 Tax=Loktanella sp. Alg231-35 TaxID=1922220 RepID=UPI000D558988|nr:lytic transglycosylase domain-containing protein [Loktanella sp. Alg231-35]